MIISFLTLCGLVVVVRGVDIADDDGEGQHGLVLRIGEGLVEVGAVVEAGELVVEAQILDAVLGLLAFGVVAEGDDRPDGPVVPLLGVGGGKHIKA